ncbi:MAG: hypothetical protein LBQ73_11315 [Tannerellaceae bacterium]|jgi:hypothetical protein|nr:hypothetical protein [Tannerellaceae bacterium]
MKGIMFTEQNRVLSVKGLKTHTRRICRVQPEGVYKVLRMGTVGKAKYAYVQFTDRNINSIDAACKPRFNVGERVYIQEPYKFSEYTDFGADLIYVDGDSRNISWAEIEAEIVVSGKDIDALIKSIYRRQEKSKSGWLNKMYMPAWAARNFIEITDVKCERLQDISEEDCIKEGMSKLHRDNLCWTNHHDDDVVFSSPRRAYAALINRIHKGAWEENPFVWAYSYELIK